MPESGAWWRGQETNRCQSVQTRPAHDPDIYTHWSNSGETRIILLSSDSNRPLSSVIKQVFCNIATFKLNTSPWYGPAFPNINFLFWISIRLQGCYVPGFLSSAMEKAHAIEDFNKIFSGPVSFFSNNETRGLTGPKYYITNQTHSQR